MAKVGLRNGATKRTNQLSHKISFFQGDMKIIVGKTAAPLLRCPKKSLKLMKSSISAD
jgi:hypothetical protein